MTTRTLPRVHGQLAVLNGRTVTPKTKRGGGIAIGSAYVPKPGPLSKDAEAMQKALLDDRPSKERNWQRAQRVLYVVSVIGILAALAFNNFH